jgi:hemolysin-activating ACP:hemolysin acyltransferase
MALWSRKKDGNGEAPIPPAAAPAAPAPAAPAAAMAPPPATVAPRPAAAAPPAAGPAATGAAEPELSAEEQKKRAAVSKHLLMSFGEIVSVMMRSQQFRGMSLAEVEQLVVPAVMCGQYLVAEAQSKSKGFVTPVATALWATVSKEVDARLSAELDKPFRLQPAEWRSGDIAWLVTIAGDARIISPMLKQLQETTLKGKPLRMRVKGKDGKVAIGTFAPNATPEAPTATVAT